MLEWISYPPMMIINRYHAKYNPRLEIVPTIDDKKADVTLSIMLEWISYPPMMIKNRNNAKYNSRLEIVPTYDDKKQI